MPDKYGRCLLTTRGTTFGYRALLPEHDYAMSTVEHLAASHDLHVTYSPDYHSGQFIRWTAKGDQLAGTFQIEFK